MPDAFSLAADELDETADVSGVLKYYDDPAGFAREAIAWKPGRSLAPYQADVLGEIPAGSASPSGGRTVSASRRCPRWRSCGSA